MLELRSNKGAEIVDKMALSVAKSGERFETKVWESMSDNPRFGFIQPNHHYHAYYRQQLDLCKSAGSKGKGSSVSLPGYH